jgi:hypothetical protein
VRRAPADRGLDRSFYPALVERASFASLHSRSATNTTVEVGATGRGPYATHLTRRLADAIARYGADHRGTAAPRHSSSGGPPVPSLPSSHRLWTCAGRLPPSVSALSGRGRFTGERPQHPLPVMVRTPVQAASALHHSLASRRETPRRTRRAR